MTSLRRPANRAPVAGNLPKPPLSPKQLRAIQAQRRTLGLDDETYRASIGRFRCATVAPPDVADWPARGARCTSARHLSRAQARQIITDWSLAGAPVGSPYSGSRTAAVAAAVVGVTTLPTPAQVALIGRLVAEVPWRETDGYARWMASTRGPTRGQPMRTYQHAEAVIEGLRALRDRALGGGGGHASV